jgi:hypothetical protein
MRLGDSVQRLTDMSEGKLTTEAAIVWGTIPLQFQQRILDNVFCVKCRDCVRIFNFTGKMKPNGDIIPKGKCKVCGHEIVRVVETSEVNLENKLS